MQQSESFSQQLNGLYGAIQVELYASMQKYFYGSQLKAMTLTSLFFGALGGFGSLMLKHESPQGTFTACALIPGLAYLTLSRTPRLSTDKKSEEIHPYYLKFTFLRKINAIYSQVKEVLSRESMKPLYAVMIYPTALAISNILFDVHFKAPMTASLMGVVCVGPVLAYAATSAVCILCFQHLFFSKLVPADIPPGGPPVPATPSAKVRELATPQHTAAAATPSRFTKSPQTPFSPMQDMQTIVRSLMLETLMQIKDATYIYVVENCVKPVGVRVNEMIVRIGKNIYQPDRRAVALTSGVFASLACLGSLTLESDCKVGIVTTCALMPVIMSLFMSMHLKPSAQTRYSKVLAFLEIKDLMVDDPLRVATGVVVGYPITWLINKIFSRVAFVDPLAAPVAGFFWAVPMMGFVAAATAGIAISQHLLTRTPSQEQV